jgi:twinkle protein
MQIQQYLDKKGFKTKRRGEELILNCPFCGDTEWKFSINSITGAYNCLHANNCGVKGGFSGFQKKLGDVPDELSRHRFVETKKKVYTIPDQNIPVMENNQVPVYLYLKSRGFNDETIKFFHIGAKENTVIIPYFKGEKVINKKYRDITDKKKMWTDTGAEPILFNRDNVFDQILVICEGEYDCMALHQYGISAVSVPNGATGQSWIEGEWDYLETFNHIKICFDNDDAGREGAAGLAAKLGIYRCSLVELPFKDANECLKKGVTKADMQNCFDNCLDLTPETIVSPDYFSSKVKKLFEMGVKLFGTPTPWIELDGLLKGWRPAELTIWTGRNGSGKSTILNQVVLDLAKRGEKSCIYSGEMSPERYLRWAVIQHLENELPSPAAIDSALDWMTGKIYILNISNTILPDKLLSDFEYAAKRYNCKHFIVDSLMKITLNENDEYNQQKQFVSRLSDFEKVHNVHVHLVAHPRKSASDTDEPGKVDVKGSSHITDLCDNVIVLYRVSEEQKIKARKKGSIVSDMQLYVKKNREFGTEGKLHFWYNENTKKFRGEQ